MGATSTLDGAQACRAATHDVASHAQPLYEGDSSDGDVTVVQSAETYRCHLPSRSDDARTVRGLSYDDDEDDEKSLYGHGATNRNRRHRRAHVCSAHRSNAFQRDGFTRGWGYDLARHEHSRRGTGDGGGGGWVSAFWNGYNRFLSHVTQIGPTNDYVTYKQPRQGFDNANGADINHWYPPSLRSGTRGVCGVYEWLYYAYDELHHGWLRWPNRLGLVYLIWTLMMLWFCHTDAQQQQQQQQRDHFSSAKGWFHSHVVAPATYHSRIRLDFPNQETSSALFSHPRGEGLVSFVGRVFPPAYSMPPLLLALTLLLFALQLGAVTHSFTTLCGVGCGVLAMLLALLQMHLMWIGCGETERHDEDAGGVVSVGMCEEGAVVLYGVCSVLRRLCLASAAWCVGYVLNRATVWRAVGALGVLWVTLTTIEQLVVTETELPYETDSAGWFLVTMSRWGLWLASWYAHTLTQWVEMVTALLMLRCTLYLQPNELCGESGYACCRYDASEDERDCSSEDEEEGDGDRRRYRADGYDARNVCDSRHAKEHVE